MLRNILITADDIEQSIQFCKELFGAELYFEAANIEELLTKYESGDYRVKYLTPLTELEGGQKMVRFYDPSGNLIEVRTSVNCRG